MITQVTNSTSFASTFYFKEIIPDITAFLADILKYTELTNDSVLHYTLYRYIYNKYCNCNVKYDTIAGFKRNFYIKYENLFKQYEYRVKLINELYKVSTSDLTLISTAIYNTAENANSQLSNPLDNVLNYISKQSSSKTVSDKFTSYLVAINKITDMRIEEYLHNFKKLFLNVFIDKENLY